MKLAVGYLRLWQARDGEDGSNTGVGIENWNRDLNLNDVNFYEKKKWSENRRKKSIEQRR